MLTLPVIYPIKNGWAAAGRGWAVHAPTRDQAIEKYEQAKKEHAEIKARPEGEGLEAQS